jgi:carbonic anhydrase
MNLHTTLRRTFVLGVMASLGLSGCDQAGIAETETLVAPRETRAAQAALASFENGHRRGLSGDLGDLHRIPGESPIDIRIESTQKFQSTDPVIRYSPFPLNRVVHTGDNLRVYASGESHITVRGKRYDLAQFHFHRRSEHAIQGRHAQMEVHLVHVAADGAIAVIGTLIELGSGSRAIQALWNLIPASPSEVSSGMMFDPYHLLPAMESAYFTYSGSLTTPPFTQGLNWIVMRHPLRLSGEQLRAYARIFREEDARALQAIEGRTVFERVGGGK